MGGFPESEGLTRFLHNFVKQKSRKKLLPLHPMLGRAFRRAGSWGVWGVGGFRGFVFFEGTPFWTAVKGRQGKPPACFRGAPFCVF